MAAPHGDNHQLLVERFYRRDRAQMFATAAALQLEATSADRSVLDALQNAVSHAHMVRDLIPDHLDGQRVDLSFASENWRNAILMRKHPGRLVRRHFEAACSPISPKSYAPATSPSPVRQLGRTPAGVGGLRAAAHELLRRGRAPS